MKISTLKDKLIISDITKNEIDNNVNIVILGARFGKFKNIF